jgi:hypothetical protein
MYNGTSGDTWGTTNESIATLAPLGASSISCSIALRSDGDIIVLYNGNTEKEKGTNYDRVYYARKEGESWTVDIIVDRSPENGDMDDRSWYGSVVVKGSSDRMHFFFKDGLDNDGYQRTLTSGNSLEATITAGDSDVATALHVFGPGISYDDSGTQRVRCPYDDGTGNISYAEFDSADTPGTFTPNVDVSDADVENINDSPVACCAVDGTDEYLVYADDSTQDLWYDKNDGTDVEHRDGVTINRISCNVYDRSGTKLAMVYDDGGTIKYDEVDIGEEPPPGGPAVGSLALMGIGR